MNHFLRCLLALLVILSVQACRSGPAQDNSETNWLKCDSAGKCATGFACVDGYCTASGGGDAASIPNPTGSCIAPNDGSRAGYHVAAGTTWLPDCQGVLQREYWRVFTERADRAYMIPRPDGARGLGAPCNGAQHPLASIVQKYGLCDSAMSAEQVATVNAMDIADAFAVARYLQSQLVFVMDSQGLGIEPFPIPSDIVDACNLHGEAANSAELAAICQRESDRLQSGQEIAFTYTGPGAVELAARLNELYGIRIETAEAGACVARQERASPDASFIYLASASVTTVPSAPACVPTCPTQPSDGVDKIGSLPAGACQPATSPCNMSAARSCPCEMSNAPSDSYHCACVNARWECVIATKTFGICLPCDGGASPDGAAE